MNPNQHSYPPDTQTPKQGFFSVRLTAVVAVILIVGTLILCGIIASVFSLLYFHEPKIVSFKTLMFGMVYVLLSIGIISMVIAIIVLRLKVWMVRGWASTIGLVIESSVYEDSEDCYPIVVYQYEVGGQKYESRNISVGGASYTVGRKKTEQLVAKYPAGNRVTVYYDHRNPANSVLMHGDRGLSLFLLIMIFSMMLVMAIFYGVSLLGN